MQLVTAERNSHWYRATDQGIEASYEMRGKNGRMRAPTIADAREQGLLVSISRIAGMLPKPYLEAWKQTQGIISALTLPRARESYEDYYSRYNKAFINLESMVNWCYQNPPQYTESIDVFAGRVVEDMEKQGQVAADFGARIHAQVEQELINSATPCPPDLTPFMVGVRAWIQGNVLRVISVEQIVGDLRFGIGGKLDLFCELNMPGNPRAVVDFKTQGIKNGSPAYYKSWALQLAGYAHCVKEKEAYEPWPMLISVVVDSKTPGPVHFKTWNEPEHHWSAFLNCLELFCYDNDYRPGKL